jgi:hypothetical protein
MCRCRPPGRLLFEVSSQCFERGSMIVTSNLPCGGRTGMFGSERLTGAPRDRLTRHVRILAPNGDSCRLAVSRACRQRKPEAKPSTGQGTRTPAGTARFSPPAHSYSAAPYTIGLAFTDILTDTDIFADVILKTIQQRLRPPIFAVDKPTHC